ncbi:glutamyl-tRNA amidotransferase [Rhizobium esperanzae]|uniref:Glutamyl-tRNA amidotransferase n=1 Tax=Rhizobium esperanzae TaxID=1967781 RepID=A0A2D0ABF7_9HYPH|nr:GatB/YqeY domain-containing protein [Rhizobium esperanzae]OWO96189.1 glutamyl-tRNA amidotransferase [Rhizobium esperanzae]
MLRDQLATQLKEAMKAKDTERLSTVRLIQAAIKDRDIANRGTGKEQASDDEILQILAKMVKQRDESAKIYEENSRPELAAKERAEIAVIQDFMPKQLSDGEVRANISAIITETGAARVKDMGKVMAALKERYAGQMDFAKASATVKELLNG